MGLLVQDIIKMAERQMLDAGVPDGKNDAEEIFCWMKRIDRSKFFLEWGEPADDLTCERFFDLIERRCKHEPLQHITGSQAFMNLTFVTSPDVLIPRQDTETVVQTAMDLFGDKKGDVLDLCCGSGVIGITIAHSLPKAKVTASDFSDKAISLTATNAAANGVRLGVKKGDLFEAVKRKKYHMIVSNPPYIPSDVIPTLMPEVKDHEPLEALDGGLDGLDFYRRIIAEAPDHLKKEGLLVLEIGHDQKEAVEQLLMDTGKFCDIKTGQDLAGNDRVTSARLIGK